MYQQIKHLADEALALQNKDGMDAALRGISTLCDRAVEQQPEQPGDEQVAQQPTPAGDDVVVTPEGGAE